MVREVEGLKAELNRVFLRESEVLVSEKSHAMTPGVTIVFRPAVPKVPKG